MPATTDGGKPSGEHKPSGWVPTGKDGVLLLLLMGGTVGGYKLVDSRVETRVEEKATTSADRSAELAGKIEDLTKKVDRLDQSIQAIQADRTRDMRTFFERGGSIGGSLESMARQIADIKTSIDAVERRSQEADRDLKQNMADLQRDVNNALRAPLIGPRGR